MYTKNYWHAIREHERDNKQRKRNRARPYIYLFLFIYLYFTNLFILFLRPLCKINSFFFTRCEKLFEIELYIHREIKSSRQLDYSTIVFNFYLFLYFSRTKNVLFFLFPNRYVRKTHGTPPIAVLVSKV